MACADLNKVFPIEGKADVVRSMFQRVEQHEKNWSSLRVLATADALTFWTIVVHNKNIAAVLEAALQAITQSYSGGSRRLSRDKHQSYVAVVARIALALEAPSGGEVPSPTAFAQLLHRLLPTSTLLPLALVLQKENILTGSAVLSALLIQCPIHLSRLRAVSGSFLDEVSEIAARCFREAKLGRFQRKSADIMAQLEAAYRLVKQMWALLHACPMVANYFLLDKVIVALRTAVDVIAPLLQYFVMSCDALAARRAQLTKATATLTSCAVDTAVIATVFTTHHSGSEGRRAHLLPRIVRSVDDGISAYLEQNNSGFVSALIRRHKSIHGLLALLCAPVSEEERQRLGPLMVLACSPSTEGWPSTQRFGEAFISELIRQGVTMNHLTSAKFLLRDEATALGMDGTQSGGGDVSAASRSPSLSPSLSPRAEPLDPMAEMVLEVMPHFNARAIPKAIEYYNGDLEHFLNDAMSGNLPPHLMGELESVDAQAATAGRSGGSIGDETATAEATTAGARGHSGYAIPGSAAAAAAADALFNPRRAAEALEDGSPTVVFGDDPHRFMSSDYTDSAFDMMLSAQAATAEYHDGPDAGGPFEDSVQPLGLMVRDSTDQLFDIDDELRDKVKQLADMMYDDERDDGEDGLEMLHQREGGAYDDDSGNDNDGFATRGANRRHIGRGAPRGDSPGKTASDAQATTPPSDVAASGAASTGAPRYVTKAKVKRQPAAQPRPPGAEGGRGRGAGARGAGGGSRGARGGGNDGGRERRSFHEKGPKAKRKARIQEHND